MDQKYQSLSLGLLTIICWASLATFGQILSHLPPFYILGICFALGAIPGVFFKGKIFPSLRQSLWGIGGFFLYHFFLFYSFRFIPSLKANLINYLWPTFMVIMSSFVFKEKLKWFHFLGASLAIGGCLLLSLEGKGSKEGSENLLGYFLALGAAFVWPIYSLGRKKRGEYGLSSIGGFCIGSSFLCFMIHLLIEPRVTLQIQDALTLFFMGLGPFAIGFYTWEMAVKKGDSKILGALANLTPALSTINLVYFGSQKPGEFTWYAVIFILLGSTVGMLDVKKTDSSLRVKE